ncbi:hypothetical protein JTB14_010013 [Gonioctena quinquepunctata]|nr:hypothetical protein JTB14_010013 [Gonioctena quinquepunctata]
MDRRIPLTDKELADIWENWSDSEDGLDFSDTDSVADPNYTPSESDISDSLVDQDEDIQEALSEESSTEVEEEVEPEDQNQLSVNNFPGKTKKLQKQKVVWKHRGIHLNDLQLAFHGDSYQQLWLRKPHKVSPFIFFNDDFVGSIVEQTNLFATQTNPNNSIFFTVIDIKPFMGISFYTSIVHVPSVGSYWSSDIGFVLVRHVMPLNEFEKIRQFIHFNDNSKQVPRDSPEVSELIKERDKMHQNLLENPNTERHEELYRLTRNRMTALIKCTKTAFFRNKIMQDQNNPKKLCQVVDELNSRKKHPDNRLDKIIANGKTVKGSRML